MFVAGNWSTGTRRKAIANPYSGAPVDEVPVAEAADAQRALAGAERGSASMAELSAHLRCEIFYRAADLVQKKVEDLAQTVSLEEGKPITEARAEAGRLPDLLRLCAFEGTQIRGESLPLDAQAGATGKLGFTLRVPCGIVLAITPFNYPLLLVMHKIGPALASGNAVILKPAEQTPLSALKLTEIFLESGLPPLGLQCITGPGSAIGPILCADSRVRKISFTGSSAVGEQITRIAGVKKLSLELGANCSLVVLPDADIHAVAAATAVGGYANAGQVCISTQRVLVHRDVYPRYLDEAQAAVEAIKVGDPFSNDTRLSAMISEREADRLQGWIEEAVRGGARLVTGGQHSKALFQPTIVADVDPRMKVSCEEMFGPAVAVTPVDGIDHAIAIANDSSYGLGAGIFTRDINHAMRFARRVHTGNVMINWTPLWRAELQPYGGFKNSGFGKEGPRYAVEEMTELKTVVLHGLDN